MLIEDDAILRYSSNTTRSCVYLRSIKLHKKYVLVTFARGYRYADRHVQIL